jgi:adenine/guanine phosphoribosyltransferase-like PRPP-binding protein
MEFINNVVLYAIGLVVAISGLLVVVEAVGFLPDPVSRWLARNRVAQTMTVLREMGLDIERLRRRNSALSAIEHFPFGELPERVRHALVPRTIGKTVGIGGTEIVQAKRYIDLMGGTTDPVIAANFARFLETFWRNCLLASQADPIDFIVTPKAGSPILGYELAKNLRLPFVIHNRREKFQVKPDDFRAHFDCVDPPQENALGLIVDDSSTGGDKVLALLDDLRKFKYDAKDCLIVFEPGLKSARKKISDRGVRLHSIIGPESC